MTSRFDTWEYHVEQTDTPLTLEELNELGQQGWELAASMPTAGHYIFKRPAADLRERITLEQGQAVKASNDHGSKDSVK